MLPNIVEKITLADNNKIVFKTKTQEKEVDLEAINLFPPMPVQNDFKTFKKILAGQELFISCYGKIENQELFETYFGKLIE
jgi:hypothetical protein